MKARKVLLNAASARKGGATTHLQCLLDSVGQFSDHEFTLLIPAATLPDLQIPEALSVRTHELSSGDIRLRSSFDQYTISRLARQTDQIVSLLNSGPLRVGSSFHTLLIRNELLLRPSTTSFRALGRLSQLTAKAADRVIVPSEYMQALVGDRWGVESEVVSHPISSSYARAAPRSPTGTNSILVPTSSQPHKNLGLISDVSRNMESTGIRHEFLVTVDELPGGDCEFVTAIGRQGADEMLQRYREADCVFIPSFYESFSYPVAEALALGVPVAASNIAVHRERLQAGCLFHPARPEEAAARVAFALRQRPSRPDAFQDGASYLRELLR